MDLALGLKLAWIFDCGGVVDWSWTDQCATLDANRDTNKPRGIGVDALNGLE